MTPYTTSIRMVQNLVRQDAHQCRQQEPRYSDAPNRNNINNNHKQEKKRLRLPLHAALCHHKTWEDVASLVEVYPKSLKTRDPQTGLFPFQLAAAASQLPFSPSSSSFNEQFHYMVRNRVEDDDHWHRLSLHPESKAKIEEKVRADIELAQVNTTFELLRRYPAAATKFLSTTKRKLKKSKIRDEKGMGIVAKHFLRGCYYPVDGDGSSGDPWQPIPAHIASIQESIESASIEPILSIPALGENWWVGMKQLIWECFDGIPKALSKDSLTRMAVPKTDDFILHAALSNPDTPPILVHLLLRLYPDSCRLAVPGSQILPLHITMVTVAPCVFRNFEGKPYKTIPSLVIESYPEAAKVSSRGRLPLHLALLSGKTFREVEATYSVYPNALEIADPISGLYPFQLAASRKILTRGQLQQFKCVARNQYADNMCWSKLSKEDKNKAFAREHTDYKLQTVSTIFELLRLQPMVIAKGFHVPAAGSLSNNVLSDSVLLSNINLMAGLPLPITTPDIEITSDNTETNNGRTHDTIPLRRGSLSDDCSRSIASNNSVDSMDDNQWNQIGMLLENSIVPIVVKENDSADISGEEFHDSCDLEDAFIKTFKESWLREDGVATTEFSIENRHEASMARHDHDHDNNHRRRRRSSAHSTNSETTSRTTSNSLDHGGSCGGGIVLRCMICKDAQRDVLLLPCRHLCMCRGCATTSASTVVVDGNICPVCDEVFTDTLVVHM